MALTVPNENKICAIKTPVLRKVSESRISVGIFETRLMENVM